MTRTILYGALLLVSPAAFCQNESDEIHHHNFALGVGPAIPLGSAASYLNTAPFVRVGYGYRFNAFSRPTSASKGPSVPLTIRTRSKPTPARCKAATTSS
jgi:hypothetical protein